MYHHWECTSIYRPLSYPFRSLLYTYSYFVEEEDEGAEEEPLGSEDDISDEDAQELYDTDNVVVCQYDKITRTR